MVFLNPSGGSAADLDGDATSRERDRRQVSGELLRPEPGRDGNSVTDSGAFSDYHALQIDLRRRLSQGLSASVNYQYAREGGSAFDGFLHGRTMMPSATCATRSRRSGTGRSRSAAVSAI